MFLATRRTLRCSSIQRISTNSLRKLSSSKPPSPPKSNNLPFYTFLLVGGLTVGWVVIDIQRHFEEKSVSNNPTDNIPDLASVQASVTDRVFLDIEFPKQETTERIVIGLYGNECPKTVENFKSICMGFKMSGSNRLLSYVNTKFHRVIPGFMLQSGDITNDDGTGGMSIYGERFPDESFRLKHTGVGVVSMANKGRNTNTSQFFICMNKTSWLDGKHVVFGQVLSGLSTLQKIESLGSPSGRVSGDIRIFDCGLLPPLEDCACNKVDKNEVLDETGRNANSIMK